MRKRLARALALACVFAFAFACGGPSAQEFPNRGRADMVVFVTFGGKKTPKFDPRSPDPRVRKAYAALTELTGKEIQFHFEEALLPKWESDFDTLFAECIETVVQDLAGMKRDAPQTFAMQRKAFSRIDVDLDARLDREWTSELAHETIRIKMRPDAWRLVPRSAISSALSVADRQRRQRAFGEVDPGDVAPGDLASYWDYLTYDARDYESEKATKKGSVTDGAQLLDGPDPVLLLKLTRFAEATVKKKAPVELREKAQEKLTEQGIGFFQNGYVHHASIVRGAPSGSAFRRAEKAFMVWLTSAALSERQKLRLDAIYTSGSDGDGTWPTFDRYAFALATLVEWARVGHPLRDADGNVKGDESRQAVFEKFACVGLVRRDRQSSPPLDCRLHGLAFATPDRQKRLVDLVLQKNDPDLAEQTMNGALWRLDKRDDAIAFWRALGANGGMWRVATRVIAEQHGDLPGFRRGELWDELVRVWRREPNRRGPLLYAISMQEIESHIWPLVMKDLGDRASQAAFADFLEMGPRAVSNAWRVVPALDKGWSRADPLVGRLGVVDEEQRGRALSNMVDALCAEKNAADLSRLRSALERRVREHPSEQQSISRQIERTRPGGC